MKIHTYTHFVPHCKVCLLMLCCAKFCQIFCFRGIVIETVSCLAVVTGRQ